MSRKYREDDKTERDWGLVQASRRDESCVCVLESCVQGRDNQTKAAHEKWQRRWIRSARRAGGQADRQGRRQTKRKMVDRNNGRRKCGGASDGRRETKVRTGRRRQRQRPTQPIQIAVTEPWRGGGASILE